MNPKNTLLGVAALASAFAAHASAQNAFNIGDLLLSSSTYSADASVITNGQLLPNGSNAIASSQYFQVFNNDAVDSSFGITAQVHLLELTTSGSIVQDIVVPTNVLVTSFSSKSELGLNLSQDGTAVTFMGYNTGTNQIDVSNGNTPGQTGGGSNSPVTYRAIAQINANGSWTNSTGTSNTLVDTSSGDNPRAAILSTNGSYYIVGNQGSTNTAIAGVQQVTVGGSPGTNAANSHSLGLYNVTQNGY